MRQRHSEILFVGIVISVIAFLFVGGLPYFQTNSQTSKGPVFVKQLAVRTNIWSTFINGSTNYWWGFSLTNEGRTPIVAITAILHVQFPHYEGQPQYTLNQSLIENALGPPAITFVRNPPLPFVGPTNPLFLNDTAGDGEGLFQSPPYLHIGEAFPIAITVTYANGTLSNVAISAQVVVVP